MKCNYCPEHPKMIDKHSGTNHWFECPKCHRTIGKKEEKEETKQNDQ